MPSIFGTVGSSDDHSNEEYKTPQAHKSNAQKSKFWSKATDESRISTGHTIYEREIAAADNGSDSGIDSIDFITQHCSVTTTIVGGKEPV